MNKKWLISGGAVLTAAVATAVAFAAPGPMGKADSDGDGAVSKAEAVAMANNHFTRMDVNKDGQINAADREAKHKEHFAAMDTDKNGSISEAEFTAAHEARKEKREAMREGHKGMAGHGAEGHAMEAGPRHKGGRGHKGGGMMMLKMADANGDKTITNAEMMAAVDAHFAKADSNKDGKISAEEHTAMRKAMRTHMKAQPAQ